MTKEPATSSDLMPGTIVGGNYTAVSNTPCLQPAGGQNAALDAICLDQAVQLLQSADLARCCSQCSVNWSTIPLSAASDGVVC